MKKGLLLVLALFMSIVGFAYDVEIDGIYYNLVPKAKVAEVTYGLTLENNYSGSVVIPSTIIFGSEEYTVHSIGDYAFYKSNSLTSVTIPKSIERIENEAFRLCKRLYEISIPNSVKFIGYDAFRECSSLQKVIIEDIAAWCGIEFVNYSANPLRCAHKLYIGNEEVSKLSIPDGVTSIGDHAFRECDNLTSVTIPNSVTHIGHSAFDCCDNLSNVELPNSVIEIGSYAFQGCAFSSFVIPNSVSSISEGMLGGCEKLTTVSIPNSVKTICVGAFNGCTSLKNITIPNSVTKIEWSVFPNCVNLESIEIPNTITEIGGSTFMGCEKLVNINIPKTMTSISLQLFRDCKSLEIIRLPNSITKIGEEAFYGCTGLKDFYCYAEKIPSTDANVFKDAMVEYSTLYVPFSSIELYKKTEPWSNFGTIKPIEGGTEPEIKKCATPSISYSDKKLTFTCETEGVEYVSSVKVADNNNYYDSEINLTATYEISVYATKSDYENSDIATATLVWTEAIFTETTPDIPTSAKAVTESIPVLISANNGNITVKSETNGQAVAVYTVDGQLLGNATVSNGQATVPTTLQNGNVAVVKIGNRAVKIMIR